MLAGVALSTRALELNEYQMGLSFIAAGSVCVKYAMPLLENLKQRARILKAETYVLYLAARHSETPWYAKLLVASIVAYAFSPIDLIPDFAPILGYLDDLVLLPLGISLAIKGTTIRAKFWKNELAELLNSAPSRAK